MKLSLQNILNESLSLRRVNSGLWVTVDNLWEIVRDPFGPGSGWIARARLGEPQGELRGSKKAAIAELEYMIQNKNF